MTDKTESLPIQRVGANILVVDDELLICKAVARVLTKEGYNCKTCTNVKQVFELLEQEPFDLILSDVMMPETSGVNLLLEVQKKWPDVAFVMISGLDDREIFLKCLQVGAYGYLTKPFSNTQLVISVITALERRSQSIQLRELQEKYMNCWDFKKCGRQPGGENVLERGECPAAKAFAVHGVNNGVNGGRSCWAIAGTFCGGVVQGEFADKITNCTNCDFYKLIKKEEGDRFYTEQEILEIIKYSME